MDESAALNLHHLFILYFALFSEFGYIFISSAHYGLLKALRKGCDLWYASTGQQNIDAKKYLTKL